MHNTLWNIHLKAKRREEQMADDDMDTPEKVTD